MGNIADIEHWVLSNVKKIIPEDVKEWWHDYRTAMKNPEGYELGDNQTSKDMDKAGWGVEEAQERHTADASEWKQTLAPALKPLPRLRQ